MKCFYHSADLDGHCSGAIVKLKYPDCEMIGINHGEVFPWETIEVDEDIFIVDFSLPVEDMLTINELAKLHWIDHHKTAIDATNKKYFSPRGGKLLNNDFAACELTWKYLNKEKDMPLAVYLLGRYDIWKHDEDSRALPFQYALRAKNTIPDKVSFWKNLLAKREVDDLVKEGKLILEYQSKQNKILCNNSFESTINGYKAICINDVLGNSITFESVYNPEIHQLMIKFYLANKKWNVSLYSTHDDINCGKLAQKFGGGGHRQAAGFKCTDLPFDTF